LLPHEVPVKRGTSLYWVSLPINGKISTYLKKINNLAPAFPFCKMYLVLHKQKTDIEPNRRRILHMLISDAHSISKVNLPKRLLLESCMTNSVLATVFQLFFCSPFGRCL